MKKKVLNGWLSCVALLLACLLMLAGCIAPVQDPDESGTETETGEESTTACEDHRGDFICVTCGGRLTPDNFFTNLAVSELENNMVLKLDNVELSLPMFNIPRLSIQTGELSLKLDDDGNLTGFGHVDFPVYEDAYAAYKLTGSATIRDGVLYLEVEEGSYREDGIYCPEHIFTYLPLDQIISYTELDQKLDDSILALLTGILPQLPDLFGTQVLPMVKELLAAHPELEDICARSADLLYTLTKTEDGYTVALSMEKLIALNDQFETMKVSELYDAILGEGKFDELKAYVLGIFDKTVAELLDECKAEGLDIDRILDMIESLFPENGDGGNMLTLVREMLKNEEFLSAKVSDLLLQNKPDGDGAPTDEEYLASVKQQISMVFDAMKESTVWDLIESALQNMNGSAAGNPDLPYPDVDDPMAAAEWDAETEEEPSLHDQVREVIDLIKDGIQVTYAVGADGKLVSAQIVLDLPDMIGTGTISLLTSYQSEINYDKVVEDIQAGVTQLPDADKLAATVIEYFQNELLKDYVITYDQDTGLLRVEYTDSRNRENNIWTGYGWTRIQIEETAKTVRVLNLKNIETVRFSDFCKNIRYYHPYFEEVFVEPTYTWTAYWLDGTELTEEEKREYQVEQYLRLNGEDPYRGIIWISATVNTETGEILGYRWVGNHQKGELIKDVRSQDGMDGYRYYRCTECGQIFEVYYYVNDDGNVVERS